MSSAWKHSAWKHAGKLHLYAQDDNHDDAWIVGDRVALTALRDALNQVLDGPHPATGVQAFCEDGEGYTTLVMRVDEPDVWRELLLPYARLRTFAHQAPPHDALHPYQVLGSAQYKRICKQDQKE